MPNAKFCGSCGLTLQPQDAPAPQPNVAPPPQQAQRPVAQPQVSGGAFHFDTDGRGQGRGYTWEIEHQGAFALAVVKLQPEQAIHAEAGAMVSMSANVDLHSEMKGGVFGALKRAVGGESAFVSTFTARGGPGEVTFAPGAPGDVAGIEMQGQMFMVQSSSYLAGDMSLIVDTKFGGAKPPIDLRLRGLIDPGGLDGRRLVKRVTKQGPMQPGIEEVVENEAVAVQGPHARHFAWRRLRDNTAQDHPALR